MLRTKAFWRITRDREDLGGDDGFLLVLTKPCKMFCHLSMNSVVFLSQRRTFWPILHVSGPGPRGSGMKEECCHLMRRCKNLDNLPMARSDSSRQVSPSPRAQCFAASGEMGTCRWNLGAVSSMLFPQGSGGCHVSLCGEQWGLMCNLTLPVWGPPDFCGSREMWGEKSFPWFLLWSGCQHLGLLGMRGFPERETFSA